MRLKDYIASSRKGKEAHRIEREAMHDPFLADALEGYDIIPGKHIETIEDIRKRITALSSKNKYKPNYIRIWGIAASLLLCISIGGYFLWKPDKPATLVSHRTTQSIFGDSSDYPQKKMLEDTTIISNEKTAIKDKSTQEKQYTSDFKEEIRTDIFSDELKKKDIATGFIPLETLDMTVSNTEDYTNVPESIPTNISNALQGKVAGVASLAAKDILKTAPSFTLKGNIKDENGEPIPGASITIKGTTQGTISGLDGNFELSNITGDKLFINYLGYQTVEIPVKSASQPVEISMKPDNTALSEVVVTGYGKARKESLKVKDVKPEPIIGEKEYNKYLKDNLIRPANEECKDAKGEVVLTFQVGFDGRPQKISVKKSLCPASDTEAIRLIEDGPDWRYGNKEVSITIKF